MAVPEDAGQLLAVFAPYVENTAINFCYSAPSLEQFREKIIHTSEQYPFIVAEADGEIIAYACANEYRHQKAYSWCAETTIYLRKDWHGRGIGKRIYSALEDLCRLQGIITLYACIGVPEHDDEFLTHDSEEFHSRLGYSVIGRFPLCGFKFGRWYSMVWMAKDIKDRPEQPSEVIPVREIEAAAVKDILAKA